VYSVAVNEVKDSGYESLGQLGQDEQWLQRPDAGSSWPRWPGASYRVWGVGRTTSLTVRYTPTVFGGTVSGCRTQSRGRMVLGAGYPRTSSESIPRSQTERGITKTSHIPGIGTGQAKRRILVNKCSNQSSGVQCRQLHGYLAHTNRPPPRNTI